MTFVLLPAPVCPIQQVGLPTATAALNSWLTAHCLQQVGPVALLCLLLSDGLVPLIPGSEENFNPNRPANPGAQEAYNRAAIQVIGAWACGIALSECLCVPLDA